MSHKALILHGTDGSSESNWIPWLKRGLEAHGWVVWAPDLPQAHEPNIARYNQAIFANQEWKFDENTVIIGHSSGAVAALGILEALPEQVKVHKTILIGSFKDDLGWPNLGGLFEKPFNFAEIKKHSREFFFIHSNDDPYCPLDHAEYLSSELGGQLQVIPGQKHFSAETDPKYTEFPFLLDYLERATQV